MLQTKLTYKVSRTECQARACHTSHTVPSSLTSTVHRSREPGLCSNLIRACTYIYAILPNAQLDKYKYKMRIFGMPTTSACHNTGAALPVKTNRFHTVVYSDSMSRGADPQIHQPLTKALTTLHLLFVALQGLSPNTLNTRPFVEQCRAHVRWRALPYAHWEPCCPNDTDSDALHSQKGTLLPTDAYVPRTTLH